jgi:biotin operon repressor
MKRKTFSEVVADFIRTNTNTATPIKGRVIATEFGISGAEVRKYINQARCDGHPICSSARGYYYTTDPTHIQRTIDSIQGRIGAQMSAINGLRSVHKM